MASGKSFDHQVDHGNVDEGLVAFGRAFIRLGESPRAVEPAECPFDDPAFRQNFEASGRPLHQFDAPQPLDQCPTCEGRVGTISPDDFGESHVPAKLREHVPAAVAVLHTGGRDHDRPEQSQRVNDNVPLPADDFFPRNVAAWSTLLRRFDTLAVEDCRQGFRRLAGLLSHSLAQFGVQGFPSAVLLPEPKIVEHDPIRRQVVRQ